MWEREYHDRLQLYSYDNGLYLYTVLLVHVYNYLCLLFHRVITTHHCIYKIHAWIWYQCHDIDIPYSVMNEKMLIGSTVDDLKILV